jgi:cytochrome c oxidase subunit 2
MSTPFQLFPVGASSISGEMDLLYLFIVAVCAFFTVVVAALVVYFTLRYRRRHADEVGADIHGSLTLELAWTFIPFVLSMVMFGWGAALFFRLSTPPANAMEVFVVGKQWMWKIQHPEGVREINELHVPIGRPIRITLGSEDVLHDFFIPAFRVKMDAVPGKLTTLWFAATQLGTFTSSAAAAQALGMIGQVIVMTPQDYEAWLAGGRSTGTAAQNGERLFTDLACVTCHKPDSSGRGPSLLGVFGSRVTLTDGRTVIADENYLRESIMNSQAKVVQGYQGIMPTFHGMVTEENLMQLIAYIKTLKPASPEAKK